MEIISAEGLELLALRLGCAADSNAGDLAGRLHCRSRRKCRKLWFQPSIRGGVFVGIWRPYYALGANRKNCGSDGRFVGE